MIIILKACTVNMGRFIGAATNKSKAYRVPMLKITMKAKKTASLFIERIT
jgi:hypothetical protein